jgi:Tannase and feruloyl esterase
MRSLPGLRHFLIALGFCCLVPASAMARDLAVVKPVMDCAALTRMILTNPEAPGRVQSATLEKSEGAGSALSAAMTTRVIKAAPFCKVTGYVVPQVRFELHLPTESWTQRLLFQGCGALCGELTSMGLFGGDGCKTFEDGQFATVISDLGHHEPPILSLDGVWAMMDAVWAVDKDLRRDFGYRGVHVTTIAAKEIIARYYGQPQAYAYFSGCSDGGREAMVAVERYPADFNGVVAGSAVMNEVLNNTIYHAWGVQKLIRPDGSKAFSDDAMMTLHKAVVAACDTLNGAPKDGLIEDPTLCHFDPATIECKSGESSSACLTNEQVKIAKDLYIGAQDPEGHPLYFGYDPGSELAWNSEAKIDGSFGTGAFPGYLASDPPSATTEMKNLKFTQEAVKKMMVFASDVNALNPDLRPFHKAGGKLIVWSGWADVAVAPRGSVKFVREIRKTVGPDTDQFLRLYMVPGVQHCGGGEGPDKIDFLSAILAWTEDGVAPGSITARKKDTTGKVIAERVLQPYQ